MPQLTVVNRLPDTYSIRWVLKDGTQQVVRCTAEEFATLQAGKGFPKPPDERDWFPQCASGEELAFDTLSGKSEPFTAADTPEGFYISDADNEGVFLDKGVYTKTETLGKWTLTPSPPDFTIVAGEFTKT